jgi:predicted peptidase
MHELEQTAQGSLGGRYLLYEPDPGGRADSSLPLILFLHGAGERGDDLSLVRALGIPRRIADGFELPALVLAPQCPSGQRWSPDALAWLLDETERTQAVDSDRICLTGLSMGGGGVWALAMHQPSRFAALAPVCGFGDPSRAAAITHIPVWAFHGARDDVVPLQRTTEMIDALRACGAEPRLTVYLEAGHDSWTETYANPDLYAWLFEQRRLGVR